LIYTDPTLQSGRPNTHFSIMFIWTSFLSPPGIDRFVVIASQDSPEIHSYTDEAIGHFDPDESVLDGAHRTIADW